MLHEKDLWEENYIKNLKDSHLVPWGDSDAFLRNPSYSHIYDKLLLSKLTNTIKVWDLEKEIPNIYPVMVKPRMNLFGLSKGSYVADSEEEIEDIKDMIAQEFANGVHYSTDYILSGGKIVASFTFVGDKNFYNDFVMWRSVPFPDKISNYVEDVLKGYTGIANFESIDGKIIEGHLRGSLQFYDICGKLLDKMPEFIKTGNLDKIKFEQTYSKVLRTRHDGYVKVRTLPKLKQGIRSVQLCFDKNIKLSETDPGSHRKRYCVINGTDLGKIEQYAKSLKGSLFITKER